ncbi:hypothetical protein EJ02DRAFT_511655 [Clathrospora elynae]|uniref:PQ-loop-domain-containing protein n=1 Tax=Clathrospora elynae TaxID=706981 RepID=A0A6A5SR09_9PLEO|nr:hypothetical protein EJ02DRAFT_511655 [Clathrospora elynae]
MDVPVAANVLGTIGAVCWSIQLIPQIIINYRRHNAIGLQPTMMMLWAWAGVPLGVYNIAENYNIALRIQPQILTVLSLVTWIQCYYYERNWTVRRSLAVVVPVACLMGGVQGGLIFAIRHAKEEGLHWPSILMAVASAVLLAAGVLRHYVDVYLHHTVRGISFIFVGIDALGDVFSLVSVVFQPKLDVLGMVIYGTELVLWIGIFMCGAYYNLIPWITAKSEDRSSRQDPFEDTVPPFTEMDGYGGAAAAASGIAVHDLPSSTSVFRTTSGDIDVMRQRSMISARGVGEAQTLSSASVKFPAHRVSLSWIVCCLLNCLFHAANRLCPIRFAISRLFPTSELHLLSPRGPAIGRCSHFLLWAGARTALLHTPRLLSTQGNHQSRMQLPSTSPENKFAALNSRQLQRSKSTSRAPALATFRSYQHRAPTATMTAMAANLTSLGSQYSASGAPSVPNPTPATEPIGNPLDSAPIDPPPEMDFAAVAKILRPIQEALNESALEAGYPSPPINTPVLSPAPSVYRPQARGRGFSLIGDRLAQLKIDNRKLHHHDGDVASSTLSAEASVTEGDEGDVASMSELLSDGGRDKQLHGRNSMSLAPFAPGEGSVPIALGSPTVNPRIEEYLSFTSKDLPANTVAPCFPSTLMETSTSSIKTVVDASSSRNSLKSDGGVTEKSNWAEELEDSLDRACMRLEQLAEDEFCTDPSKSVEQYYISRLERLLGSYKRIVPVKIQKIKVSEK